MINEIKIEGFKSIADETLKVKPLTILTGLNSTGKSSVLQAVLIQNKLFTTNGKSVLMNLISSFDSVRNRYRNDKKISLKVTTDEGCTHCVITQDKIQQLTSDSGLEIEKNLYYLSANRTGVDDNPMIHHEYKVGINGEFLLGTFENEKSTSLADELVKDDRSTTLAVQVNYWLSHILNTVKYELQTEKITETNVVVRYKSDDIQGLSPLSLGMGVSYLTKIIIACLRAQKSDVVMIENPEIHLHPAAQARLGDFFAFIVKAGVQLIIETHCEHLINQIQYEIYQKHLDPNEVTLLYKAGVTQPFEVIEFNKNGNFAVDFPEGFFDATLSQLLEME